MNQFQVINSRRIQDERIARFEICDFTEMNCLSFLRLIDVMYCRPGSRDGKDAISQPETIQRRHSQVGTEQRFGMIIAEQPIIQWSAGEIFGYALDSLSGF